MKKIDKLYDNNYIKISYLNFKFEIITFIFLVVILFLLFIIKKDYYYENIFKYQDKNIVLIMEKDYYKYFQNNKKIKIDDLVIDCNVDKIEEEEGIYLVYGTFNVELVDIKTNKYQFLIKKENILEYILRIMKGDLN